MHTMDKISTTTGVPIIQKQMLLMKKPPDSTVDGHLGFSQIVCGSNCFYERCHKEAMRR